MRERMMSMGAFRARISKRLRSGERGQSLVELALSMVLFVLLLVGVADFGRAFNNYITIANASREGARYASHFPHDGPGILDRTKQETVPNLNPPLQDSDISIDNLNGVAGERIRVIVTYQFQTIMGGLVSVITGSPDLTLQFGTSMVIFGLD